MEDTLKSVWHDSGYVKESTMITIATQVDVHGLTGDRIYDFMLHCTDADYQRWWPGTHLAYSITKRCPGDVGSIICFDEYVGRYRINFEAVILEIHPGRKVVAQMKKIVRLPAWLSMEFEDLEHGVRVFHTLTAGFRGAGSVLDPLLRVVLSRDFERAMNEHAQLEFARLKDILA